MGVAEVYRSFNMEAINKITIEEAKQHMQTFCCAIAIIKCMQYVRTRIWKTQQSYLQAAYAKDTAICDTALGHGFDSAVIAVTALVLSVCFRTRCRGKRLLYGHKLIWASDCARLCRRAAMPVVPSMPYSGLGIWLS